MDTLKADFNIPNKKRILVVDDDPMLLDVTRELLQNDAYEVYTHIEGIGVMNLVSQLQPNLVLLDINMPVFSGESIAVLLRMSMGTGHIRVVFYSSNDEDSLRESVSACRVHGYICKGDILNLRTKVDQYLGLPCPSRERFENH